MFTGPGYSGSGITFGSGGDWCSEACYQKNASPAQKKADAATSKIVWTIILLCVFPPLLFLLYWKQTLAVVKFLFRIIFSEFFWKYVVPTGAIVIAVVMYVVHREKVKACELEMARFAELTIVEAQRSLDEMKAARRTTLRQAEKRRQDDARKRAKEEARRKAELDAAIAAVKAEQQREQEAENINAFAQKNLPEAYGKLAVLSEKIQDLENRLDQYDVSQDVKRVALESDAGYVQVLVSRNKLILERRMIEQAIAAECRECRNRGAQK